MRARGHEKRVPSAMLLMKLSGVSLLLQESFVVNDDTMSDEDCVIEDLVYILDILQLDINVEVVEVSGPLTTDTTNDRQLPLSYLDEKINRFYNQLYFMNQQNESPNGGTRNIVYRANAQVSILTPDLPTLIRHEVCSVSQTFLSINHGLFKIKSYLISGF